MSSRESTEQGQSGRRGAEAAQSGGEGGQPRQGSNRVEEPSAGDEPKHHFEPGQAPSEQGESGNPSPEKIARNQQGYAGSGTGASGNRGAHGDRTEEVARADSVENRRKDSGS